MRIKARTTDFDWDVAHPERTDALVDSKRALEHLDAQRVGWEPDWKLRLVMLREEREEELSEKRTEVANRPEIRAQRSRLMKAAWEAGKFSTRIVGCSKRTDERVLRARRMRADGLTLAEIALRLAVTSYTVAKWLGWHRPPEPTNRKCIEIDGVKYPSLREAERRTGIARSTLTKRLRKEVG